MKVAYAAYKQQACSRLLLSEPTCRCWICLAWHASTGGAAPHRMLQYAPNMPYCVAATASESSH